MTWMVRRAWILSFVVLAGCPLLTSQECQQEGQAMLSRQPIAFVENRGQWDGGFTHRARMGAMTVFVQERGWTFTLVERHEEIFGSSRGVAVAMKFDRAGCATPVAGRLLPGINNFFLGNDPRRWQSGIPRHGSVRLTGLYPGIDVGLRSADGRFEYDLLVEPGADLAGVVIDVAGTKDLRIDIDGTLIIDTDIGPVRQTLPRTWQITAEGERQEIACTYVLRDERSFGFAAPGWDSELALVVDPGLVYSSYLGGSDTDHVGDLALDANGAATVCGLSWSSDFPTAPGAFQDSFGGGLHDAFVTRIDSAGGALLYSTYIGGLGNDAAGALVLDATGAATICGATSGNYSPTFPTTPGAFQTSPGGVATTSDAFVARFDLSGGLVYSTYLGGSSTDNPGSIAIDAAGAVTVVGWTVSSDFPTTSGAFQAIYGGGLFDAFVTRLHPSDIGLLYSTFLGGSGSDSARDITVDATGAATVHGWTTSPEFPVTTGAFQTTYGGGHDAFVTRFEPSGSPRYSTFVGGSGQDIAIAIGVDAIGAATILGRTWSPDFPTTPGALQTTGGGGQYDGFVTRLDPLGQALIYSTYLGGSGAEYPTGMILDSTGAATVCGSSTSPDFPTTPGAFQTAYGGGGGGGTGFGDAFVTRLDPVGGALIYSTYLGGSETDQATSIALDATGAAAVYGWTASPDFPTTPGAFQRTYGGGAHDVFVARLDPTGGALLYSTYLGGSGNDFASTIAFDTIGAATVYGETTAADFPTTFGAFQATYGGGGPVSLGGDAFVTRLILSGPGQGNSGAASLLVDGAGSGASGPILTSIQSGGTLTLDWVGPPNFPFLLYVGPANPAIVNLGCVGILDIGTPPAYSDVSLLIDGTLPGQSFFSMGPSGTARQTFPVPVLPPGPSLTIQGVVFQPVGPCPFVLTAAFTLAVN